MSSFLYLKTILVLIWWPRISGGNWHLCPGLPEHFMSRDPSSFNGEAIYHQAKMTCLCVYANEHNWEQKLHSSPFAQRLSQMIQKKAP